MAEIADYENTDAANSDFPEGWTSDEVNNAIRDLAARLKRAWELLPWVNIVQSGDTVSKVTDTQVKIAGVDYSEWFGTDVRVRCGDGVTMIEDTVASVAFTTDTIVTLDNGTVPAGTDRIYFLASGDGLGDAAYLDTGAASGKIPAYDDLSDTAFTEQGTGNGLDADTVDGIEASAMYRPNLLVNGEFRRWQALGPTIAAPNDDTYCADQWKILVEQNGAVDVARTTTSTEIPLGAKAGIKITQAIADKKWALYQLVESDRCAVARTTKRSFSFKVKLKSGHTSPANISAAAISWIGSEDSPTSDPVATWSAAGSEPLWTALFLGGAGTWGTETLVAGSWVTVTVSAPSAGYNNFGIFIWSDDDTIAVGQELYISQVKFEAGDVVSDFVHPDPIQHIAETDRYFAKTFGDDVVPAHTTTTRGASGSDNLDGCLRAALSTSVDDLDGARWQFPAPMMSQPSMTDYNPMNASPAAGDHWGNLEIAEDLDAQWRHVNNKSGFCQVDATGTAGDRVVIHAVADARFF